MDKRGGEKVDNSNAAQRGDGMTFSRLMKRLVLHLKKKTGQHLFGMHLNGERRIVEDPRGRRNR